jgi:hypothetical protein
MTQLAIKVRGEVLSSNFDEWKLDLIDKIRAVNTELETEDQFARAQADVKSFKAAEQALQKAKAAAIDQAADIQSLFAAIDSVSAEVRQVRLTLERQIKQRKAEIKDEAVEFGIATIRKYIELQNADFRCIDHAEYLDRSAFVQATRYRASVGALQGAIDDACANIKTRIDERAVKVADNAAKLASLPAAHQALFQDRSLLLALEAAELDEVIGERIAVFEQRTREASGGEGPESAPADVNRLQEHAASTAQASTQATMPGKSTYRLTIELQATLTEAEEFFRRFRSSYAADPLIRTLGLEKL